MHRLLIAAPMLLLLAACQQPMHSETKTGAVAGGLLGAAVADDGDRAEGAVLGAIAGGALGEIAHESRNPRCKYTYPDGRVEYGPCR